MHALTFLILTKLAKSDIGSQVAAGVQSVCKVEYSYNSSSIYSVNENIVSSYALTGTTLVNFVMQPGCFSNFTNCYNQHKDELPAVSVQIFFPLGIALIMLIAWITVFMPCAACRCCRRSPLFCCLSESRGTSNFSRRSKIIVLTWTALFIGGFFVTAYFAILSNQDLGGGTKTMYCETYRFANDVINGYLPDSGLHNWIGIDPFVAAINEILANIATGSTFLTRVNAILDKTNDLNRAVTSFNAAFNLLQNLIITNANIPNTYFGSPLGNALTSSSVFSQVTSALNTGLAGSLNAFRTSVQSQLTGNQLLSTHDSLASTISPMTQLSSVISLSLGNLFITNRDSGTYYISILQYVIYITSICVILPGLLMLSSVFFGVFRSHRSTYRNQQVGPQNPLHASCSWCITYLYAFVILLVAGVFIAMGFFFGTTCIIMQNLPTYISPLMQLTGGGNNQTQLTAIVNSCLMPNATGNIKDSLLINGKPLSKSFDASSTITGTLNSMNAAIASSNGVSSLATNSHLVSLMHAVTVWGGIYLLTDAKSLQTTPGYASTDPHAEDLYAELLKMTPECVPANPSPSSSGLKVFAPAAVVPATMVGVKSYLTSLATDGISIVPSGANPTCNSGASRFKDAFDTATLDATKPFGKWAMLAKAARSFTGLRCDTLTSDGGSALSTGTGSIAVYTSSVTSDYCVGATIGGNTETNFGAWLKHLNKFKSGGAYDIIALAKAVDVAAAAAEESIVVNLAATVASFFTTPINKILSQLDCSFLAVRYNNVINALCAGAIPGLMGSAIIWVVMGLIAALVVIMEFYIWRRLRDNYSLWLDYQGGRGAIFLRN